MKKSVVFYLSSLLPVGFIFRFILIENVYGRRV